jgi:AcrR family transcriptional regulator
MVKSFNCRRSTLGIRAYTDEMALSLSSDTIVEAGVRVVARDGWSELSLRAVASELEVTPMALYRHIGDSGSLMAAVVEAIVERLPGAVLTGSVSADLTTWARTAHDELSDYPGVAGYLLTMWFDSPAMLERIDELLGLVYQHGIDGFEAVAVVNAVFTFVLMRCEAERTVRSAAAVRRTLRTASAARPLHRLNALAAHYATAEFDAHFEFGLRSLIAGMELPGARSPSP